MTESSEETEDGVTGPAAGSLEMLKDVRREVVAMLADLPQSQTGLRVQASDVTVEVAWDGGTQAEAGPAGPPVPSSASQPASARQPSPARQPAMAVAAAAADTAEPEDLYYVCAPTVGVFYRATEPGAKPLVAEGDLVSAGEQVAIVEAMKLFLPVEADRDGRVVTFLVANGSSIEFGERLIALEEIA